MGVPIKNHCLTPSHWQLSHLPCCYRSSRTAACPSTMVLYDQKRSAKWVFWYAIFYDCSWQLFNRIDSFSVLCVRKKKWEMRFLMCKFMTVYDNFSLEYILFYFCLSGQVLSVQERRRVGHTSLPPSVPVLQGRKVLLSTLWGGVAAVWGQSQDPWTPPCVVILLEGGGQQQETLQVRYPPPTLFLSLPP